MTSRRTRGRALLAAATLAAIGSGGCGNPCKATPLDQVHVGAASGADDAAPLPYNRVFRVATHNSYWVKRDTIVEAKASGVQERILDQLLVDHARGLEFDIHRDDDVPGRFSVYHTEREANSLCTPLEECLKILRMFHYAVPQHESVNIVIELKELVASNFDGGHTPDDLDALFVDWLADANGSWLFRPSDLMARCPGAANLRACAQTAGAWPTTAELRGKFIVTVLGNWRYGTIGQGPQDWVQYATFGGGPASRAAFVMRSNWINFNDGGTDPVAPAAQVQAAYDGSVFWQVEDLADPSVPAFLAAGGIVRAHDSFSVADQEARIAAGFQLVQTDDPWLQAVDDGAARPLHPLDLALDAYFEPGTRMLLQGDANDNLSFLSVHRDADGMATWQTLPSTTRPPTTSAYQPVLRPRGRACLRAADDATDGCKDSVMVCREVVDGEYAHITMLTQSEGNPPVEIYARNAPANAAGNEDIGDLIQLRVDVGASGTTAAGYAASNFGPSGDPLWVPLATAKLGHPLRWQGVAATRDVLFVDTRLDGQAVHVADFMAATGGNGVVTELSR